MNAYGKRAAALYLSYVGRNNLGKTKTGVPRSIPVHPTLGTLLREWKDAGWERIFGRPPTDDDLIVPTRNMTTRQSPEAQKALHDDLALLELRPRRGHDLRRTFITLAQVDGARKDILEAISHGPRGDIVSVYTTFPWPALCAEVAKLKIEPAVVRIPRGLMDKTRYTAVTGEQSSRNRWTKRATPAGFETGPEVDRKPKRCAGLHRHRQGLGPAHWGQQRSLGNVRNPLIAVQMGPWWARSGPKTRWGRAGYDAQFSIDGGCPISEPAPMSGRPGGSGFTTSGGFGRVDF